MRWMMYRWCLESGVIGGIVGFWECFFHWPEFWACLGDIPQASADVQRHSFFRSVPLSSERIVPGVTIAEGSSIHPTWDHMRPIVIHSIAGCLWLPRPTSVHALTVTNAGAELALLLIGGNRLRLWQSAISNMTLPKWGWKVPLLAIIQYQFCYCDIILFLW